MTNKQEETVERLNQLLELRKNKTTGKIKYDSCICGIEDLETVLNLLKEKDISIIEAKEANRQLSAEIQQKTAELAEKSAEIEKKDKIIDFMAEYINEIDTSEKICEDIEDCYECKICIKQYFERKVEDEQ